LVPWPGGHWENASVKEATMSGTTIDRTPGGMIQLVKRQAGAVAYGAGWLRGIATSVFEAVARAGGPSHGEWIAPLEPLPPEALGEPDDDAVGEKG